MELSAQLEYLKKVDAPTLNGYFDNLKSELERLVQQMNEEVDAGKEIQPILNMLNFHDQTSSDDSSIKKIKDKSLYLLQGKNNSNYNYELNYLSQITIDENSVLEVLDKSNLPGFVSKKKYFIFEKKNKRNFFLKGKILKKSSKPSYLFGFYKYILFIPYPDLKFSIGIFYVEFDPRNVNFYFENYIEWTNLPLSNIFYRQKQKNEASLETLRFESKSSSLKFEIQNESKVIHSFSIKKDETQKDNYAFSIFQLEEQALFEIDGPSMMGKDKIVVNLKKMTLGEILV